MIENIGIKPAAALPLQKPKTETGAVDVGQSFSSLLNDSLAKLSEQQAAVDAINEQFVKGEVADTHQVMIAAEKASLGLELTVQIRNKVIEAYQDIMRMQI